MTDMSGVLGAAGDDLWNAARQAALSFERHGGDAAKVDVTAAVMSTTRLLCVHVAQGDGALTQAEASAIDNIFWLSPQPGAWTSRDMLERSPELVTTSVEGLRACIDNIQTDPAVLGSGTVEGNGLYLAVIKTLQSVVAADGSVEPEVARLNDIGAALRAPIKTDATSPDDPTPAAASSGAAPEARQPPELAATLAALDQLVGLDNVKQQVATLSNLARVFEIRRKMGLPVPPMSFHLVFLGNPGTGKTTVARIIAQVYGALGLLTKGQLVEVDRSGLVANFVGQTATKVEAVVQSALGGVLFIDEAYALDGQAAGDFGQEAVATLIKAMEDNRSDLVVIAAGYTNEMQRFLDINPGIRSRMGRDLVFEDYSPDQMTAIFHSMASGAGYSLPDDGEPLLAAEFARQWSTRSKDFANARDVRNTFERVIEAQANRLLDITSPTEADMITILASDYKAVFGATSDAPMKPS